MSRFGTVVADHHQFVLGSPSGETYEPEETGSVVEVGPNFATVMTGVAYGPVTLTVEVLDDEPSDVVDTEEWGIVEEATVNFTKPAYVLTMDGEKASDFPKLPIARGLHRFRVFGRGRDTYADAAVTEPTEHYLVQIWKTTRPREMVRLHKIDAAWDQSIVTHPKRNWWDPDPAGDATLYLKYGYDQMARWAKDEAIRWGGRPPSEKLRSNYYAMGLAGLDRPLADAITRARTPKLRRIATWAARRAYTTIGIAEIPWISAGLTALDRGDPLPHPFGEHEHLALEQAFRDEPTIDTTITGDAEDRKVPPALRAISVISTAAKTDPLNAVFHCLHIAARTDDSDYTSLIEDVRREFFPKLMPVEQYERWI
ncbi:transposase [Rhodococcus sp. NPDC060086]|uniref:transposase n=1 Tax=unclassified Rhodococcus (in: high G+C Gram-positive bacteria) TaxID=192944 RepID=UPI0036479D81